MKKVGFTVEAARELVGIPTREKLRQNIRMLEVLGDDRVPAQDKYLEAAKIVLANYPKL